SCKNNNEGFSFGSNQTIRSLIAFINLYLIACEFSTSYCKAGLCGDVTIVFQIEISAIASTLQSFIKAHEISVEALRIIIAQNDSVLLVSNLYIYFIELLNLLRVAIGLHWNIIISECCNNFYFVSYFSGELQVQT